MSELLSSNVSKFSITELLMEASSKHLSRKNVPFIIAGNNCTLSTYTCVDTVNNHEEADSLMINCMMQLPGRNLNVLVHSIDTDVFLLLLKHCSNMAYNHVYVKNVKGYVSITNIQKKLGQACCEALLSLHSVTGCDTTGKFSGISKSFWIRRFLQHECRNVNLLQSLIDLQHQITDGISTEIESFICRCYLFPKSVKNLNIETKYNFRHTRYELFRKKKSEREKLPPTSGTFNKHLERSFFQLNIWASAHLSLIPELDPLLCGWYLEDDKFIPKTTDDPIAPKAVAELVSCNCKGNFM